MLTAVVGEVVVSKDKLIKAMQDMEASEIIAFPSGALEDVTDEVSKELGLAICYDVYASCSWKFGVTNLMRLLKQSGGVLVLTRGKELTTHEEFILNEANSIGVLKIKHLYA